MMRMKFFYGLGAYLGNKVEQANDVDLIHCQEPNKQTATKIGKHSFVEKKHLHIQEWRVFNAPSISD